MLQLQPSKAGILFQAQDRSINNSQYHFSPSIAVPIQEQAPCNTRCPLAGKIGASMVIQGYEMLNTRRCVAETCLYEVPTEYLLLVPFMESCASSNFSKLAGWNSLHPSCRIWTGPFLLVVIQHQARNVSPTTVDITIHRLHFLMLNRVRGDLTASRSQSSDELLYIMDAIRCSQSMHASSLHTFHFREIVLVLHPGPTTKICSQQGLLGPGY